MKRWMSILSVLLVLACGGLAGCERHVVRSQGYGGFQIDSGGATPAPTAIAQPTAAANIKTERNFDIFAPFKSAFAGMGKMFSSQKEPAPAESKVQSGSEDSAYRPSWRKADSQANGAPEFSTVSPGEPQTNNPPRP